MQAQDLQLATLLDQVRNLPAEAVGRDRRLHKLIDLYAFAEAASALKAAGDSAVARGVLEDALKAAREILGGSLEDRDLLRDDSAARDRLLQAFLSPAFVTLLPSWIAELRAVASARPETGACTLASALELWSWTFNHFRSGEGARGEWAGQAIDELADPLCLLLASRSLVLELASGAAAATPAETELRTDLCRVQSARASASTAAACAELVFGYRKHLGWDAEGCSSCYAGDQLDELEALMPGIASGARSNGDVVEADGSHPPKAGPCARFEGVDTFVRLRDRLDGCLTGARFARDRAAAAIARSMTSMTEEGKA